MKVTKKQLTELVRRSAKKPIQTKPAKVRKTTGKWALYFENLRDTMEREGERGALSLKMAYLIADQLGEISMKLEELAYEEDGESK